MKGNNTLWIYGIIFLVSIISVSATITSSSTPYTIIDPIDGLNYTVYRFDANGTFNTTTVLTNLQVLAVAGGAGGGWYAGGGGGAGGVIYNGSYNISANNYTIIVGGGGLGAAGIGSGYNGYNSSFSTLVALGGGAGGNHNGANGGSGGGGGGDSSLSHLGGSGLSGQGFNGGNSSTGAVGGGGGGGSNTTGFDAVTSTGGRGGYGTNYSINGSIVCYAGGGGGSGSLDPGVGGCRAGTGADQAPLTYATNATPNSGSGGGGGYVEVAGNGGSGIVIIRYLTNPTTFSINLVSPSESGTTKYLPNNYLLINTTITGDLSTYQDMTLNIYNSTGLYYTNLTTLNASFWNVTLPFINDTYYYNITARNTTNSSTYSLTYTNYIIFNNISAYINFTSPSENGTTKYLPNNYLLINASINLTNLPIFSNMLINIYNSSGLYYSYNTTNTTQYLNITLPFTNDTYYYNVSINNGLINSATYTNYITYATLNITLYNTYNYTSIQSFNISISSTNHTDNRTYGTTTGYINTNIILGDTYNIIATSPGYTTNTTTYTANQSTTQQLNITTSIGNALQINLYDEALNTIITQNSIITLTELNTLNKYQYNFSNGQKNLTNITNGLYSLSVSSPTPTLYTPRTRVLTVNTDYQIVNVYLASNSSTVLLNYKLSSGAALEGVLVIQKTNINGTIVTLQSVYSDVTGRALFSYIPYTFYQFTSTISGYANNSFNLNPVISSSYDIIMTPTGIASVAPTAWVTKSDVAFYNNQNRNYTITFFSTYNGLVSYSYNLTGPGVAINGTGVNTNGETFTTPFTITGATSGNVMTLYYQYLLSNGANYNLTINYPINIPLYNNTILSIGQGETFGFQLGDRIMIVVIITIICFGVGLAVFGPIGGMLLSMANIAIFTTSGFVPEWMMYGTVVLLIIIIIGKGVDNG